MGVVAGAVGKGDVVVVIGCGSGAAVGGGGIT